MKRLSSLKFKESLRETCLELQRKSNFICIYPSPGSDSYDQFFHQVRPMNKFLYKMLFTEEIKNGICRGTEVKKEVKPQMDLKNVIEQLNNIQNACNQQVKPVAEKSQELIKENPKIVPKLLVKSTSSLMGRKNRVFEDLQIFTSDILIEYLLRVHAIIKDNKEQLITPLIKTQMLKFLQYPSWQGEDFQTVTWHSRV